MDKDKGWLGEILKDVNEDAKSWPKWLKDEKSENPSQAQCAPEADSEERANLTEANFD